MAFMYRAVNDWIGSLPSWSRPYASLGVILLFGFASLMALYFGAFIILHGVDGF